MYAKMKELGPFGGVHWGRPLDPPLHTHAQVYKVLMTNAVWHKNHNLIQVLTLVIAGLFRLSLYIKCFSANSCFTPSPPPPQQVNLNMKPL